MEQKTMMMIVAGVAVIVLAAGAAIVINNNSSSNSDGTRTVTDSAGRTVEISGDLDDGIVCVGWWVPSVVSMFDAKENVIEMDYQETQASMGVLQPHYYTYDMSKMKTHEDTMMGSFSEASIETIGNEEPSLVIVASYVYEKYKDGCDVLGKKVPMIVVDLNVLMGNFWETDDSGNYVTASAFASALSIVADAVGEEDRDEEIVSVLDATLKDIRDSKVTDTSKKINLSGSCMAMATGDLNVVFPMFNVLDLAGATNAASSYTPPYAILSAESYTSSYDFDVMFYDPTNPSALANADDQAILKWLYGLQGTSDEKKIYVILPTALCGYNFTNVISDAYFTEYAVGSLTMDQMETKVTALYSDLFGSDYASIWDSLISTMDARGAQAGIETQAWVEVEVSVSNEVYTFVAAD